MSNNSDPQNFVQEIVKVVNTSRDDVNGSTGVVVNYNTGRGRYSVVLGRNPRDVMSFKPENLQKANFIEGIQAKYLLSKYQLMQSPQGMEMRRQWTQFSNTYLPSQLRSPEAFFGSIGLVFLLMVYFFGFLKVVLFVSLFTMPLLLVGQELMQGTPVINCIKLIPSKIVMAIRDATGYNVSYRVATSIILVMYALSIRPLISSPQRSKLSTRREESSMDQAEKFYKMGWDDAMNSMNYGSSMSSSYDGENLAYDDYSGRSSRFGGMWSQISVAMSLAVFVRALIDLAKGPEGMRVENIVPNLKRMEPWRVAMLAFSLYRVVKVIM